MMKTKTYFIYQGPHYVHAEWAKAVGSVFIHFRIHKWLTQVKGSRVITRPFFLLLKKPKLVIAEGGNPLIEAALIKINRGCPIIYLATDITPYKMIKEKNLLLKDLTEFSDFVIANSKMMIDDLLQTCHLKKYFIVYPFVRDEFFKYKFLNNKDDRKAVFLGALWKFKGVHLLPKIAEKVKKKIKGFKIVVIGKPYEVSLKETETIKPLGFTSKETLIQEISSAKVYLHPAIYEPFGVSIAEAIMLGTVPVVSNKTGIKEFLPKELIADSLNEFIEKTIWVLELNKEEYYNLIIKIREELEPKVKKEISINTFKKVIGTLNF
ncbi:glycosyltransferase family 4 protein [Candidatus Bathyarchaeota archaeon]|nr:glycosyltransferase family 4 protein [Candidatus Bathyarchaeota archaeon]